MKPTQQQIKEAAKTISEPFDSRYGSCLKMAEWMQQQLEPIITELEMEKMRAPVWVDIHNRLPESSGQVLGCLKDTLDIYVCFYKPSSKLFLVYGAGADPISDMKVTHWMTLPIPPTISNPNQ